MIRSHTTLFAILFALTHFACTPPTEQAPKSGIEDAQSAREEFIHAFFEAFNKKDTLFLKNSYAPNAVLEDPDHPWQPIEGSQAIIKNYQALFDFIPDVQDSIKTLLVNGNMAGIEFISTGSIDGNPFRMRIFTLLEFDPNGKIKRDATYYDRKE